tara:strand:- start:159 stop:371 length:213 start_codon:yes stop_codon:yes gene_type:complete
MDIKDKRINSKIESENELIDLKLFIKKFVYSNWNNINVVYKINDIIIYLDNDEDEYTNDEEIFYKGIIYT